MWCVLVVYTNSCFTLCLPPKKWKKKTKPFVPVRMSQVLSPNCVASGIRIPGHPGPSHFGTSKLTPWRHCVHRLTEDRTGPHQGLEAQTSECLIQVTEMLGEEITRVEDWWKFTCDRTIWQRTHLRPWNRFTCDPKNMRCWRFSSFRLCPKKKGSTRQSEVIAMTVLGACVICKAERFYGNLPQKTDRVHSKIHQ